MTNLRRPEVSDLVEIGRGGFGVVYRARQEQFRRDVAVKIISATLDARSRARFTQECRALGQLSGHPHIVSVYDGGIDPDDHAFLIMPFFARGSLAQRLRASGPLDWREAVDIGVRLAGALHTAHEAGILHRDLKPANVLIDEYGAPRLADFGQARFVDTDATRSGDITATPGYAAPEVIQGRPATPSADVYSLAATVTALILGRAPFEAAGDESVAPVLFRVLSEPPPDLRRFGVPDPVQAALHAALAKDPAQRPRSALLFAVALQRAQQELGLPVSPVAVPGQPLLLPPDAHGGRTHQSPAAPPAPPPRVGTVPYNRVQPLAGTAGPPAQPPTQLGNTSSRTSNRRRWGLAALAAALVAAMVVAGVLVTLAVNEPEPSQNLVARDLILPLNALPGAGWQLQTDGEEGALDLLLDGDGTLLECLRLPVQAVEEENNGALLARDLQTSAVNVNAEARAVVQTAGVITSPAADAAEVVDALRSPGFDLCLSEAESFASSVLRYAGVDFEREHSYPEPALPTLPDVIDGSARRIVVPLADPELPFDSAVIDVVFLAAGDAVAGAAFVRYDEPIDSTTRDSVVAQLVAELTN